MPGGTSSRPRTRTAPCPGCAGSSPAYVSGVGVNAILPARAGDVVRIFLAHRAIPGSSYTTIVSSTVVLTFVDMTLALVVFVYALTQGVLPSLDALSALPAFDYSWAFEDGVIRPGALLAILVVVGGGGAGSCTTSGGPAARPRRAGVRGASTPRTRYLRTVVGWQLADWALRLTTIWFFLGAFGIHQSIRNVLLVQATTSLATLVPATPGGIGTEQALLVYAFRDIGVARSTLLAFSVGMKLSSPSSTSSSASPRSSSRSAPCGSAARRPPRPEAPPPT